MRVAITGASGLVGAALCRDLVARGDAVTKVVRRRESARRSAAYWNPEAAEMDERGFEGHDAVVHLAGESIFGLWTRKRRERIRRSRVQGTELLASGLAALNDPPRVLVTASAIGYYGDRPGERLDESAAAGTGFMPDVVRAWEAAAEPAVVAGIRTVHLRFGLILAREGGIVGTMLPLFRIGLGGVAGPGDQVWSWVALDDVVDIVRHVIDTPTLHGPINTTSPNPVTARTFSKTFGRVLRRPVLFHAPQVIVRLAPGGMGQELAIASADVEPGRLLETGYSFRHPTLEGALRAILAPAE